MYKASLLIPINLTMSFRCGSCMAGNCCRQAPLAQRSFLGSALGRAVPARAVQPFRAVRLDVAAAETERLRLHNLSPQKGSRRDEKRKGRGYGGHQVRQVVHDVPRDATGQGSSYALATSVTASCCCCCCAWMRQQPCMYAIQLHMQSLLPP